MIRTAIILQSVPGIICCGLIFNKMNPFLIWGSVLFNLTLTLKASSF